MPAMVNGGDPMHQTNMIYPGNMASQQQPGQPHSVPPNSGQYGLPPTPSSLNALPSNATGNPSPRPLSDLQAGLPPTPILSIDTKKDIMNQSNKMLSPTSLGYQGGGSNQNSTDHLAQAGSVHSLPGSVKTEVKNEPLLSPSFPPGSITGPPMSQQQQIRTELNTGLDPGSVGNISVPPLPDNLPSVSNMNTPTTGNPPEPCTLIAVYDIYMYVLVFC